MFPNLLSTEGMKFSVMAESSHYLDFFFLFPEQKFLAVKEWLTFMHAGYRRFYHFQLLFKIKLTLHYKLKHKELDQK